MVTRSLEELKEQYGDDVTEYINKIIYFLQKDPDDHYGQFMDLHKEAIESDDQKEIDECFDNMENILWDLENHINEIREMMVIEKASKK